MINKLKDKDYLKEVILTFIIQNKKRLLSITILFFIFISIGSYLFNSRESILTISLNYKEAAEGLNPNKSRFNIFDIKSDKVLNRTLELCGLKDTYNVKDFYNDIKIEQNGTSTNIPTTYTIHYTKNLKLYQISSKQVMKFLFKAYKEYFKNNYSNNNEILTYTITDYSNEEYQTIVKKLELETNKISDYLTDRLKENTTFKSNENYTFEDLKKTTDNINDINISNLNAYISENGLAKNKKSLHNLLIYKNELLDVDYQTNLIGYKTRKKGIKLYDSHMSSILLIPTKDEEDDYYMSKTKIGIDYLAKDANSSLTESEWYQNEIAKNKKTMSMLGKNNTTNTKEKTNQMIENIQKTLKDVSEKAIEVDNEYIEYKNKSYISDNIQSAYYSKKTVLLSFIYSMILSLIFNITYYNIKKKKNKTV